MTACIGKQDTPTVVNREATIASPRPSSRAILLDPAKFVQRTRTADLQGKEPGLRRFTMRPSSSNWPNSCLTYHPTMPLTFCCTVFYRGRIRLTRNGLRAHQTDPRSLTYTAISGEKCPLYTPAPTFSLFFWRFGGLRLVFLGLMSFNHARCCWRKQ